MRGKGNAVYWLQCTKLKSTDYKREIRKFQNIALVFRVNNVAIKDQKGNIPALRTDANEDETLDQL